MLMNTLTNEDNSKELLAFRSALRHACRHELLEGCRVTFGLDSQVCVWHLKRGRSSSTFLNHILQSCLPLALGARISCRPVWISIEHNAADDATRNQYIRKADRGDASGAQGRVGSTTEFAGCRDLRITVQPKTMERYLRRLQHLAGWLSY
eukprot:6456667-Amphidinium_carterae.1